MSEFPHLSDNAASKISLPQRERIQHIRKARWIGYGKAREILEKLEDLLVHPPQPRMPNMLLIGETNNGKTMLVTMLGAHKKGHPGNPEVAFLLPITCCRRPSC